MSIVPVGPLIPSDSNFSNSLINRNLKVDGTIEGSSTITSSNLIATNITSTNLVATNTTITNITSTNLVATNITTTNLEVSNIVNSVLFTNTNEAVDYDTGSIITYGGIGLAKDLYANGTINTNEGFAVREDNEETAKQGAVNLVGGCATVPKTSLEFPSRIFLTIQNPNSGTVGSLYIRQINYGSSFIIQSTSPDDQSTVAYEIFGASNFICFHSSCYVKVKDDNGFVYNKQINKLTYGENVLVMDGSNKLKYSPIMTFTGVFPIRVGSCVNISFYNNNNDFQTLSLSGIHLVYASKQNNIKYYKANELEVGDSIFIEHEGSITKSLIVDITNDYKTGWYTPLTKEGTIVVNDVIASCHTTDHTVARIMYWPYQKYLQWFPYKKYTIPDEGYQWYSIGFRRSFIGKAIASCLEKAINLYNNI